MSLLYILILFLEKLFLKIKKIMIIFLIQNIFLKIKSLIYILKTRIDRIHI